MLGEAVFAHRHGNWRDDYRTEVPDLHDPKNHKYVAVAESGPIVGYVAWNVDPERRHGEIHILAVSAGHRCQGIGTALCELAFADMEERDVEVVTIGTGGDDFHARARALYESLGCTPFPVAVYFKEL